MQHDPHKLTLGNLATLYLRQHTVEGSPTNRAKRRDLILFLAFMAERGYRPTLLQHWTPALTTAFRDSRLADGCAPSTVCRELATIKCFGRKLMQHYPIKDPTAGVRDPIIPVSRPKQLTPDEVSRVMDVARAYGSTPYFRLRNYAYLQGALQMALRASSLLRIDRAQVDLDARKIYDVWSKGNKFKTQYINTTMADVFREYLPVRDEVAGKCPALFLTTYKGKPRRVSYEAMKRHTRDIGEKAGVTIHAHLFRHTHAHWLLDKTKDITIVSESLGHSNINTTMIYARCSEEKLAHAREL